MKFRTYILVLCLAFIPISAFSGSNTSEDAIQARQEIMKYIGSQMRTLGAIQRGSTEFDPSLTKGVGQAIYSMSLSLPFLLVEGSFEGDTDAKPEILTAESFRNHVVNFQNASQLLSQAAIEDDFSEAFSQLGQTCSACHREFRK